MATVKIKTEKGEEKINIDGVAKTSRFAGEKGIYLKISYKGSKEETIVGPFKDVLDVDSADQLINP